MDGFPDRLSNFGARENGIYVSNSIKSNGDASPTPSSYGTGASNVSNAMNEYFEQNANRIPELTAIQPNGEEMLLIHAPTFGSVPASSSFTTQEPNRTNQEGSEVSTDESSSSGAGKISSSTSGRMSLRKRFRNLNLKKKNCSKNSVGARLTNCWDFRFRGRSKDREEDQSPTNLTGSELELRPPVEAGSNNPFTLIDFSKFNPDDYPIDDVDERARVERAREIEEGVETPSVYSGRRTNPTRGPTIITIRSLSVDSHIPTHRVKWMDLVVPDSAIVHTQVDYIHCLIPDLIQITHSCYYWGKIDRYEAERLLDNKPEGTFLLRDSAQDGYQFSVSFRRYGRSLHARIEQFNHKFSFDSHDPGVFASSSICNLIDHYKDPKCCMFFEPMLTIPLKRNFVFSLQHYCRATITSCCTYDGINILRLPKRIKSYLKEYHYKQKVRVKWMNEE